MFYIYMYCIYVIQFHENRRETIGGAYPKECLKGNKYEQNTRNTII